MTTTRGTTFTTTVWVVDRVHGNTTNGRANATPAFGTSFTQRTQAVLGVRDFTQGRAAFGQHFTHFTAAQTQGDVDAFTCDQLSRSTSGTSDLSTFTRLQLDTVNGRTHRNVTQRQAVAGLDRRHRTCNQLIAGAHTFRRDDVTTLTVGVFQQSDVRGTVRVIFNALDSGRNAIFVVATKIDQTVVLLVTTTDMTGGDTAVVVTTARLRLLLEQWSMRSAFVQLLIDHLDHKTAARGSRFAFNDCHDAPLPYSALLVAKSRSWPG